MRFILATIVLLASATAAAADSSNSVWTGFYLGGHAGAASGGWNGDLTYSDPVNFPGVDAADVFGKTGHSLDDDAGLAGIQAGYNYQMGNVVLGIETDVSWATSEADGSFTALSGDPTWRISQQLDVFGTVRARLGYAVDKFMVYGTGGFAWAKTSADLAVTYGDPIVLVAARGSADETHVGWAAGLGAEWAFAPNWSLAADWLHIDLGKEDYRLTGKDAAGNPHVTDSFPSDLEFDVFRVGINYRFGG